MQNTALKEAFENILKRHLGSEAKVEGITVAGGDVPHVDIAYDPANAGAAQRRKFELAVKRKFGQFDTHPLSLASEETSNTLSLQGTLEELNLRAGARRTSRQAALENITAEPGTQAAAVLEKMRSGARGRGKGE